MNTLQLIARAVGEKIALVYTRLKTHTAEENIHRTSAEIRAEIVDADIPAGIARAEDMRQQLAGKVDKVPGKELMPSPGVQPRENHFLNERGEYVRIEAGSVILDMQMIDANIFTVNQEQLREYIERAIVGDEPGLNVYFKHQSRPFSYTYYKVTDIIFEYTTYWLTAYTNCQSEDEAEKDMVRHFTYSFIYDDTQPEPLLPNRGLVIDSPYYISTYIDRVLGGKADAGTVKTHLDNTAIHRTSAEIRAEIVDADIPLSITRDAEADAKISAHNENGNAHPGLRNSIANLENGTTPAGRSEYAQKLGDTNGSYTKTQLDICLCGLIRDVTYDSATAKFTFWFPDGRTIEIDTPLENTVKDGRYDTATASLVLVLVSGQEISIPVAGLNKIYTGKDTATATTTVSSAGEIAVALKQGAIDSLHLSSALQAAINSHLTLTGDTKDNITTFADQPARVNLASGDKHSLLFGKIKRWFSDLGALAFLNKVGKTDMDAALQGEINNKVNSTNPTYSGSIINDFNNYRFYQGQDAGGGYIELATVSPFETLSQIRINKNKTLQFNNQAVVLNNDSRLSDARPAKGGNADTMDGLHAAAIGTVEGGKLASYDPNGYMTARIFKDTYEIVDSAAVGLVCFKISQEDGYHRFCSLARFKAVLGNMPPSGHNHTKSQITDFPASLPANGGVAAKLYQGGNTNSAQMVFNWSGQSGQPTWLWGGTDGTNMYVYNPASFSVTNSVNLGGVAAGNFARRDVANTFAAYCDFPAGAGNSGSDMRFKKEITPVENILPDLLDLDLICYTWAKPGETQRDTFGLSASQLLEKGGVFGKIVHERGDEDATQWVEYDRVGVLALKGLQEIARKTEGENALLRQELNSLRQEMTGLREYIQSLKNMILR